jgi:hypothetical protein
MSIEDTPPSVDAIYNHLAKIIENKEKRRPDQVGSLIVGCTLAKDGIEHLFVEYPILEEIAEIGADLEWQGKEYFDEYIKILNVKIKDFANSINIKKF